MLGVGAAESIGDEHLDPLADELIARIAEELLRLCVDEQDAAILVDDDHRIRRRFEETSELLLRLLSIADVSNRARHERLVFGLEGAQADLDRELASVLATGVELEVRAHGPSLWIREEVRAMSGMVGSKAVRDQH